VDFAMPIPVAVFKLGDTGAAFAHVVPHVPERGAAQSDCGSDTPMSMSLAVYQSCSAPPTVDTNNRFDSGRIATTLTPTSSPCNHTRFGTETYRTCVEITPELLRRPVKSRIVPLKCLGLVRWLSSWNTLFESRIGLRARRRR
jgi:hypothetical protein